jgi:drug/metabolite transporter (DMT)-like permease
MQSLHRKERQTDFFSLFSLVIFFVSPIFRIVIASGTLNESYSAKDGFYSIICFIALLLVIKPCFLFNQQTIEGSSRLYGISCALIGTYMSAMSYITVRKIGSDTHALVHMVYSGFVASCFGLFICLLCCQEFVIPDYHQFKNQFMLGSIGVFAFLGQCLLNEG